MIQSIERFPTPFPVPFSKAVRAGGFLFLSGQLAIDANANVMEADITVQTRVVCERIKSLLEELGSGMQDVVRATIWLDDLADFATFNIEYARHFPDGLPTRSCVQAPLYKGALVEIEVQAYVGAS